MGNLFPLPPSSPRVAQLRSRILASPFVETFAAQPWFDMLDTLETEALDMLEAILDEDEREVHEMLEDIAEEAPEAFHAYLHDVQKLVRSETEAMEAEEREEERREIDDLLQP